MGVADTVAVAGMGGALLATLLLLELELLKNMAVTMVPPTIVAAIAPPTMSLLLSLAGLAGVTAGCTALPGDTA
jgi:hypothetical protein